METKIDKKIQITAKDLSVLKSFSKSIHRFAKLRQFKDCLFYAIQHKHELDDDVLYLICALYHFFQELEEIYEKYPNRENFINADWQVQDAMIAEAERRENHE